MCPRGEFTVPGLYLNNMSPAVIASAPGRKKSRTNKQTFIEAFVLPPTCSSSQWGCVQNYRNTGISSTRICWRSEQPLLPFTTNTGDLVIRTESNANTIRWTYGISLTLMPTVIYLKPIIYLFYHFDMFSSLLLYFPSGWLLIPNTCTYSYTVWIQIKCFPICLEISSFWTFICQIFHLI